MDNSRKWQKKSPDFSGPKRGYVLGLDTCKVGDKQVDQTSKYKNKAKPVSQLLRSDYFNK